MQHAASYALPVGAENAEPQILIVEDHALLAEMLVDVLRHEGYDAFAVSDGFQALRCLRRGARPDLILLDLMMPAMDGFEFRRRQQSDPDLAGIPVAVMAAVAEWYKTENPMRAVAYLDEPLEMCRVLSIAMQHCGAPRAPLGELPAL